MKHYLLIYDLIRDYQERRGQFRAEHLDLAWRAHGRGELVLGGALPPAAGKAVLLFKADSATVVEEFASADPYVRNGLVERWTVEEWHTVVGDDAIEQVRPEAC